MNLQSRVSESGLADSPLTTSVGVTLPTRDGALTKIALDNVSRTFSDVFNKTREIERSHHLATVLDTAIAAGMFKTFVRAVDAVGLAGTLCNGGPFTIFAPTDQAFEKFSRTELRLLFRDRQKLFTTLTYHIVPGWVAVKKAGTDTARTIQGNELTIHVNGGGATVNSANVIKADVMASNGIIHAIDSVMFPDRVAASAVAAASGGSALARASAR